MTIDRSYNNNSCSNTKCSTCNLKLICASSPYCLINESSTQSVNDIQQLKSELYAQINTINSMIEQFNQMNLSITSVEKSLSNLSQSVDSIKNVAESINQPQVLYSSVDQNNYNEEQNKIVPYEEKDDKVIVEKKGLFGKTKWVEQKR